MELDRLRDRLIAAEEYQLNYSRKQFIALTAALDAMSPLKVLTRGYTIASAEDGRCIKSAKDITQGDILQLTFSDGKARCLVEDIEQ